MKSSRPLRIWTIAIGETSVVDGADVRRMRTGLLSRYLRARGHDVTFFTSTVDHRTKTQRFDNTTIQSDADGVTLIFLKSRLYTKHVSFTRIKSHQDGAKAFAAIAEKLPQPDVIACSYPTPEVAAAVREYAALRNIPFILDLRDMWPDLFLDVAPKGFRWLAKLALFPFFWSARKSMRAATGLVGIAQPFLNWGLKKAGRKQHENDRVFHHASDPQRIAGESLAAAEKYWDDSGITGGKLTLVFSGMLSPRHDLDTLVEAAHMIPERLRDSARIVLCGKGEAEADMREKTANLPHVVMAGWRNLAEIQALFARSHIGLLPYRSLPDFLMSYPNKVGEYLGAGLPILTCLKGEVGNLIRTESCGVFYPEDDAYTFAKIVGDLIEGRIDREKLVANARDVYRRQFDAETIYNAYADYLEGLARS